MATLYPFEPARRIGVVYGIDGTTADVSLDGASRLPMSYYGQSVRRGEIGEFLVVDVGGCAVFGRLISVWTATSNVDAVRNNWAHVPAQGRLQLLSTLELHGQARRGIAAYPRIGDPVYAAGPEALSSVLGANLASVRSLHFGRLSQNPSIEVDLPAERVFGRHLAIVGATGSGKSWSLASLAEQVMRMSGKMILVDATGEFHTLRGRCTHVAVGSLEGEPDGTTLVSVPHYLMRESDRNAFFTPSAGAQLPKLRAAIRSLKLVQAIQDDPNASDDAQGLISEGLISKAEQPKAPYLAAERTYYSQIEDERSRFDLRLLARQLEKECIFPSSYSDSSRFGGFSQNDLGYLSSLISRVIDVLQQDEIMNVISPPMWVGSLSQAIQGWFESPDSHVFRISLRNLPFSNSLREIVVNIIGQMLLKRARLGTFRTRPLVVALDEAHQFFDVTVGDELSASRLNAFDLIAKEGRKYGLTTCVVTQRPSDLPAAVLSQVGMTIIHRLADGRDRQRVEQAAAELDHSATGLFPGLVPGEAVLMGVDFPVPMSVKMDPPRCPPESAGPNFELWGS